MGFDPANIDSRIVSHFNGGKANGMRFCIDGSRIRIEIENSDYTGKKGADGAKPIGIY
ncbi:MAG: hypothetical protein J5489_04575 [Lachnospiraceae bacterium]|nr:hypothetical protein [Lachnospiraceae bacterium]